MGTQVTHEPPSGDSPESSQTPLEESESRSPITQPTAPPTPGPTDPAYLRLLEGSLAESNRRLQEAETRLAKASTAPPPPPKTEEEERQEFYTRPVAATRQLIREELEASVGEITQFVREFKGQTASQQWIDKFKTDSRFAHNWDASVEQYLREQLAQMPAKNMNDNTVGFLVVSAIGLKASGMLQGGPPPTPAPTAPTPPTPTPTVPTPPYMRPSPPAGPEVNTERKTTRPLNENEQRLLREYNASKPASDRMTEAQFIKWQELPSAEVATADFDKPKPKK